MKGYINIGKSTVGVVDINCGIAIAVRISIQTNTNINLCLNTLFVLIV